MVFKNEEELKKYILSKCKSAIASAENKIYVIIKKFVVDYYKDYDPILYVRTLELLHSLVKSEVRQTVNGYEADVYFDLENINYDTGNQPTGEEVMAAASQGLHGAIGDNFRYKRGETGVDVWNTPLQIIDANAIRMLEQALRAEGIPIKK